MSNNEQVVKRLLELAQTHPDADVANEQKELLRKLATAVGINVDGENNAEPDGANHQPEQHKKHQPQQKPSVARENSRDKGLTRGNSQKGGFSSARNKFEQGDKKPETRKPHVRKSAAPKRDNNPAPAGGNECDLSDPKINAAYDEVREDSSDTNWLLLGYGGSKKDLQLYGSGKGGLQEFVSHLKDNEVVYGYVRILYGDSQRSKFVFVTYVPDTLSGLAKAKANMHKPSVDRFLKYHHVQVSVASTSDLSESAIQAKLAAAAGANYGTGGAAPAGSENFGNIKNNARSFFSETEKKGSVSISYNKDPLSHTTPVNLTGRAGITEKYIS